MAPQDEENYFSDDDIWDQVTADDVNAAQNDALQRFTQVQQSTQRPASTADETNYFDDDDDDDYAEVTEVPAPALPTIQRLPQTHNAQNTAARGGYAAPSSQRFGSTQRGGGRGLGIRGAVPPTQANPQYKRPVPIFNSTAGGWTQSQQIAVNTRQPQSPSSQAQTPSQPVNTHLRQAPSASAREKATSPLVGTAAGVDEVEALRKQLEELKSEKDRLASELLTKQGEAANIRNRSQRAAEQHEREIAALRAANAEAISRQQQAVEDAKRAEQTRATELEFAKRDLNEEARKVKELKKQKERPKQEVTTPTKNKSRDTSFRDGFDDDEIAVISPSKFIAKAAAVRSANSSPRKPAAKRKRKASDGAAQVQALDVVETLPPPAAPAVQPISKEQKEEIEQDFYRSLPQDESLEFIEKVLAYRRDAKSKKTIEEFASYQFPSKPEQSFSTIIFDALAKVEKLVVPPSMLAYLGEIDPSRDALIQFCETLVGLWERCISESYHEPLPLVLDWLTYALTLRTSHIAPHILHSLLPIAQSTVLLIAYPRFRNRPVPDFASHISVPAILELLKLTLYGCIAASRQATEQFWKHVRLDFILTMLSIRQPIAEFQTVTTVLASSVLRETVGPVVRNIYIYGGAGNAIATHNPNVEEELVKEQEQAYNTSGILDRLSLLLIETPSSSTKSTTIAPRKTCTPRELWRLRLQILSTLKAWSTIPHGLQHLITHNTVIGRIAKCLSTALDGIYGYPAHQAFLAECINSSVGLLHYFAYVCNKPGEAGLDIKAKTDVLPSGFQTYMLTLARLNSVERGVTPEDGETERIRGVKNPASFLLGGVSIATLERAQELLEDCVTPEEGDGIGDAFWSASRESQ